MKRAENSYQINNPNPDKRSDSSKDNQMVFLSVADDVSNLTYEDVTSSPDRDQWRLAIKREINTLERKKCWIYMLAPKDARPITCRFVFKIKKDAMETFLNSRPD